VPNVVRLHPQEEDQTRSGRRGSKRVAQRDESGIVKPAQLEIAPIYSVVDAHVVVGALKMVAQEITQAIPRLERIANNRKMPGNDELNEELRKFQLGLRAIIVDANNQLKAIKLR